jgi:heme exporter protein D
VKPETLVWGALVLSVTAIVMVVCEVPGHGKRINTLESEVQRLEKENKRLNQDLLNTGALLRVVIAGNPETERFLNERLAREKAAGLR